MINSEYRLNNNMFPSNLIHPGEYIKNEMIKGKQSVNIEFAMLLEAALGIDADIWIRLQNLYNKQKARMNPDLMSHLSKVTRIASVL